jgi:nicotinamide N-methyltransferase
MTHRDLDSTPSFSSEETMPVSLGLDNLFTLERELVTDSYTHKRGDSDLKKRHHFQCSDGKVISLNVVGHHPLWGHHVWNASVAMARFIEHNSELFIGKSILELGAGAGLPSIMSALCKASLVIATEYPDHVLLQTLWNNIVCACSNPPSLDSDQGNVDRNIPLNSIHAMPLRWGSQEHVQKLLECSPNSGGYDVIIMSDLIFNHSQHIALLQTCSKLLAKSPHSSIYCTFSHHIPKKADQDLNFFELAQHTPQDDSRDVFGYGEYDKFRVTRLGEELHQPMFDQDPGDVLMRSIVHFYKLIRSNAQ